MSTTTSKNGLGKNGERGRVKHPTEPSAGQEGPPARKQEDSSNEVTIRPLNMKTFTVKIVGNAPLVINAFSRRQPKEHPDFVSPLEAVIKTQEAGSAGKNTNRRKPPKNFTALFEAAKHVASDADGAWCGIHAGAFRSAMIDACRLVGFKMTVAKLAVFVVADGFEDDGTPLVKITKGEPRMSMMRVRNDSGVMDVRPRPLWDKGWEAIVTIQVDADQFSVADVTNLMVRAGKQVGICEGRPNSKESHGCGWGTFDVDALEEQEGDSIEAAVARLLS